MIPATQPFQARYRQGANRPDGTEATYFTTKQVVAWDDDGHPLVVGRNNTLCRADCWSNYEDVCPENGPVVAAIPGGGWRAQFKDGDDIFTMPVVAWLITDDGFCRPTSADTQGFCDDPRDSVNFVQLIEPEPS
ncbi:hypothetical protein ACFY04_30450 [Streptomyces sp. NPDC001549]|uniref:hypothetical protein n=1 Tax=Streptomyces sp. NPDC001549 TaxID=3364586 RepID=UPI0036744E2F